LTDIAFEECTDLDPSGTVSRCTRRRSDGSVFDFGRLHFDHDTDLYRIEPVPGEVSAETYPNWGSAAEALLERHQRTWGERRDQLRRELAECDDTLALIGDPPPPSARRR
jgi:hypothetical protein